ncbi:sigma-70 family RNA polymerase sigma factor [Altererythrobacter aquiaggeris]|uniref:sigma-70 family RNA polymerase sigma factor n=1 Tax=Aestuarierythrobacter aquiaggeris TaxID=1898396 RepID=UPI003019FA97
MAQSISDALEQQVEAIIGLYPARKAAGRPVKSCDRFAIDRHFSQILRLLAPRIRHFIGRYGLLDLREDAEQACAIAVHRAIAEYDKAKARFTTFVNWQLRGELQSLRFRMRLDQRGSARRICARTVSLALPAGQDNLTPGHLTPGHLTLGDLIVDEDAELRVTRPASDLMARRAADAMLDDYSDMARRRALEQLERATAKAVSGADVKTARLIAINTKIMNDRAIAARHLLGGREMAAEDAMSKEQKRQVARRVLRHITKRVAVSERFNPASWSGC